MFCMFFCCSLLPFWDITHVKKTHFSKGILWGPFVEWKTKEAFCFAKPWSHYNTWISYYCFVSTSGRRRWMVRIQVCFVLTPTRHEARQFCFFLVSLLPSKTNIILSIVIELPFLLVMIWNLFFLSWNELWCRLLACKASIVMCLLWQDKSRAYLFIIYTNIQCLFEEYLCPPGRRFGIIKPLTLVKSPACFKESRRVFVPRSWFKSAVNLAIEEQVSQAVESRNAASSKTKHPLWTYGSFAKLRQVSVLEIRTAF